MCIIEGVLLLLDFDLGGFEETKTMLSELYGRTVDFRVEPVDLNVGGSGDTVPNTWEILPPPLLRTRPLAQLPEANIPVPAQLQLLHPCSQAVLKRSKEPPRVRGTPRHRELGSQKARPESLTYGGFEW